jgi:hypothetical protein
VLGLGQADLVGEGGNWVAWEKNAVKSMEELSRFQAVSRAIREFPIHSMMDSPDFNIVLLHHKQLAVKWKALGSQAHHNFNIVLLRHK